MDCVNHSGVSATAYCQHCGKALCTECVRKGPAGQIFCQPCWTGWQSTQQHFAVQPPGGPSPVLAGFLGLIPGVGAMYNGQFVKGLAHIVIFATLVSATDVYQVFGWLLAGWIFYQVFESYHTAKARRDGEPLPDPLGLNEIHHWFGLAGHGKSHGAPGAANPAHGYHQAQYQPPYQPPYEAPYPPPADGMPPVPPPIPPIPPVQWRRREPIGAIILIALGLLFLAGQVDWFHGHFFAYLWPLLLISLGVWLVIRRLQDSHLDSQGGPQ